MFPIITLHCPLQLYVLVICRAPDKIGHVGLLLTIRNNVEDAIPSYPLIDYCIYILE